MEPKQDIDLKKRVFTLFTLFFPSVLLASIPSEIGGKYIWSMAMKALILGYQFIVIKNFTDSFYGE